MWEYVISHKTVLHTNTRACICARSSPFPFFIWFTSSCTVLVFFLAELSQVLKTARFVLSRMLCCLYFMNVCTDKAKCRAFLRSEYLRSYGMHATKRAHAVQRLVAGLGWLNVRSFRCSCCPLLSLVTFAQALGKRFLSLRTIAFGDPSWRGRCKPVKAVLRLRKKAGVCAKGPAARTKAF